MKLANPFPLEVRLLYLDCWRCFLCGSNGNSRGGLSIHHIMGRVSGCAFNSSCLCGTCHETMGHSHEEEQQLFALTLQYLHAKHYSPNQHDIEFLVGNYHRLLSEQMIHWLRDNTPGSYTL